jgi:hypothetical protein
MRALIALALTVLPLSAAGGLLLPDRDRVIAGLPVWRNDSDFRRGSYVYKTDDPAAFVIAFPANLEQEKGNPDSHLVVDRFRLQNETDPTVSVTVSLNQGNRMYAYAYTIRNGPAARQPIWAWKLVDPADDHSATVDGSGWFGFQATGVPPGSRQAIPGLAPGIYISWNDVDHPIAPRAERSGFRVTSEFLPGLTTAAFVGGGPIAVSQELPLAVSNQLLPFFTPEVTNQVRITIGPRFPPSMGQPQWAAAFARELRALETVMPDLIRSRSLPSLLAYLDMCASGPCGQPPTLADSEGTLIEGEIHAVVNLVLAHQ